jgi:cell division protein FtsL
MEENQTPTNVVTQVETPKKSSNSIIVVLIILVILVVILSIGIVFLLIQNQNITNTPKTVSSSSETISSKTTSNKTLKFSTFENDLVSFQYPEGWKVVLNEPNSNLTKLRTQNNLPCKLSSDFNGVYNIRLVKNTTSANNTEELEYGLLWGGIGSGGYEYDKSDPLKLFYIPEGMDKELEPYILTSNPKILPINLLSKGKENLFFGEYTNSKGSKVNLIENSSFDEKNPNLLYISEFGFWVYDSESSIDQKQIQKLKFTGTIDCGEDSQYSFDKIQSSLLAGYNSIDESPEDIVKIYETFITSLRRK